MNIKDFTGPQKQALLELATLAMYADGHLAGAEDDRVHRLLSTMGFATESEQEQHYDAAVARVRQHCPTVEQSRRRALELAQVFASREQRCLVQKILDDVVTSDSHVALQESGFMAAVREALEK